MESRDLYDIAEGMVKTYDIDQLKIIICNIIRIKQDIFFTSNVIESVLDEYDDIVKEEVQGD